MIVDWIMVIASGVVLAALCVVVSGLLAMFGHYDEWKKRDSKGE